MTIEWVDVKGVDKKQILNFIHFQHVEVDYENWYN